MREPGFCRPYSDYGMDWTFRALNPGRGKRFFFLFPKPCVRAVWSTQPNIPCVPRICAGGDADGFDVGHSSASISEVKNEWSCISTTRPACP